MDRVQLHYELLKYCPNVYYQPPSNITMKYPCIIYSRTPNVKEFANDGTYIKRTAYSLTVIDKNPESLIADNLDDDFVYCSITQHYVVDNLNHTILNLYI